MYLFYEHPLFHSTNYYMLMRQLLVLIIILTTIDSFSHGMPQTPYGFLTYSFGYNNDHANNHTLSTSWYFELEATEYKGDLFGLDLGYSFDANQITTSANGVIQLPETPFFFGIAPGFNFDAESISPYFKTWIQILPIHIGVSFSKVTTFDIGASIPVYFDM